MMATVFLASSISLRTLYYFFLIRWSFYILARIICRVARQSYLEQCYPTWIFLWVKQNITFRILSARLFNLNLLPVLVMKRMALSITLLCTIFIALRSFSSECPTSIVSSQMIVSKNGYSLFSMVLVTSLNSYSVIPLYWVL